MKILVPVKRVVDANVRVRVSSTRSLDTSGLKMALNPFDECAVEKALRLRELGVAASVTVLTCDEPASQDILRTALAMGADDAVLITTNGETTDSLGIARIIAGYIGLAPVDQYGLVLCGKQAIDDDIGGVAAMLGALLGWAQALDVSAIEATLGGWIVTCGDDAGTATWQLDGPAVVSADLRLAEPRRVTLPSIIKARQKPLTQVNSSTFNLQLASKSRTISVNEPAERTPGIRIANATELISALGSDRLFRNVGAQS